VKAKFPFSLGFGHDCIARFNHVEQAKQQLSDHSDMVDLGRMYVTAAVTATVMALATTTTDTLYSFPARTVTHAK